MYIHFELEIAWGHFYLNTHDNFEIAFCSDVGFFKFWKFERQYW